MPRRSCRFLFPLFIVRLGIAPYDICISENVYRWLCLLPGLCDEDELFDRQSLARVRKIETFGVRSSNCNICLISLQHAEYNDVYNLGLSRHLLIVAVCVLVINVVKGHVS